MHRIWKQLEHATAAHIFGVAFLVSILSGFFASTVSRTIIGGEGHDGYLELAQNLVAGNGYVFTPGGHKVFHRPPTYPTLLIPAGALPTQFTHAYIILLNSALFAGTVALLFRFANLLLNKKIAIAAAAILLLNPFLLYGVKNPVSAICQMFLYLLVLTTTWSIAHRQVVTAPALIFQTIVLWAAVMSHGIMLPIILGLLFALLIRTHFIKLGPTPLQILSVSFGLLLLVAPWTWRNYKVTGLFIPVAGNAGLAYFAGNAHWGITQPPRRADEYREDSEFRQAGLPLEKRRELMTYYGFTDPATERLANQRALAHAREHPADFAKKILLNGLEYYFPAVFPLFPPAASHLEGHNLMQRIRGSHPEAIPLSIYHFILVVSALVGFGRLRRSRPALAFALLAAWAIYALSYFPFLTFIGHALYTYGTLPIVSLLAATFWVGGRECKI